MNEVFAIPEGDCLEINGVAYRMVNSIPRQQPLLSQAQEQTTTAFGKLWGHDAVFGDAELAHLAVWYPKHMAGVREAIERHTAGMDKCRVLDAGCGMGLGAYGLLDGLWNKIDYTGVDASSSVETARHWLASNTNLQKSRFLQADFCSLPDCIGQFDIILALGTLHHSDSVGAAIKRLAGFLSRQGLLVIWSINEQKPLRRVTDGYLREYFQRYSPEEAEQQMLSFSRLSQAMGSVLHDLEIDVPEDVACLGLPKGRIRLQTLLYDYILKAYFSSSQSLDRINMSHFDWFYPKNYHQTNPTQLKEYLAAANLKLRHLHETLNGLAVVAQSSE